MFLTYAFYELATVPAMYVHPYGTRKVRNRLMASRKEDTPAPTKYVWNTIFPNIVKKNIKSHIGTILNSSIAGLVYFLSILNLHQAY